MAMDRRQFLRVASLTALGATIGGCAADANYAPQALARPELLGAVGPEVVRTIGATYRAMTRAGDDAASLRAAIVRSRPWPARLLGRHVALAELVRSDFEGGRTVVVDGWILSETEARQCALFSLLGA